MTIREYIEQAIDEGRTIEIEYVKYDGTSSKRSISDLSYSDEYGDDYIVGYCHLREEYRTFKISRIRRIDGKSFSSVSSNVSAGKTAYTGKTAYSSQTTSNLSPTPTPSTLNTPRVTPTTSSYKPKQTYSSSSYASPKKSEGCYIATMAYGSYEHPQVKILRKFRDEQLMPTALGRIFVKVYYWISPKMVSILSGHDSINRAIRCLLDCFIIHISKKLMKIQRKNEYLEEAVNSKRSIVVLYMAKKKPPKKRTLQDIVYSSRSKEYISAYCNLRNDRRTFKVSRIISIDGHFFLLEKLEMLLKAIVTIIMIIFVIALFGATLFL